MYHTSIHSFVPRFKTNLFALAVIFASAAPAFAETPPSCLHADEVDHTHALNDHQILFYMRGNKVWLNTLQYGCTTLPIQQGFVWSSSFPEYCANSETIRVVRTGEVCRLGDFTPYEKPVNPS
jgi:hypothetical protein